MLVSDLIDRIYSEWLYPSGISRPSYDVLASDISADALTIPTEGRITIPRDSLLEIGSELILVESVGGSTIEANERGYLDTDKVPHTAGERVYLDPRFTRKAIFTQLRTIIGDLYPTVYRRIADSSLTYTCREALELPAGTLEVLRVRGKLKYSDGYYSLKLGSDYEILPEFTPPKIQFFGGRSEGDPLTIVCAKDFILPTDESQDLTTVCGIPSSLAPHLAVAVAGILLQAQELPRAVLDQIRRLLASQGVQVGAALNIGGVLRSMFERRVVAEHQRLRALDPLELTIER